MLSSKDLYIAEHERLTALAEDEGMDWQDAYEATADAAWDAMRERAADLADDARRRARDTDQSPEGGNAEGGAVRSTRAGAEGIAQGPVS